ncbi:hypothetical protein DRJ22_00375 [Candidatus Woesearchaeota archaeon]|nr:MAG: hypothetical protein B6U93_00270 [Candidatus Woesearchaeota archaeon ex4484_78]RLE47012.1 MAG: hypothetical protein DRJ22_00375 [Candidatus Woesearchaeota archaeon]
MTLRKPKSMEECVYYTKRDIGKGKVTAWVFRGKCPKCGKGLMGKPKDPKTGQPKIRAKEYICENCGYTVPKQEYEETLTANIEYTCPHCSYSGEKQIPFKRKKVKGVDSLVFECDKCGKKILITKKMK